MWDECVIDASMGVRGGMLCFCPVERDAKGEITNIVIGANYVGSPPRGSRIVAVVHEGGQGAVEDFCEQHKDLIAEAFAASGMEARQGGDVKQAPSRSDDSPSDAQKEV